ncbi:hypothetical protein [Novacetimonas pomaceti]|uniref:hypothetical protein n=1 Tax=Novacetimonas pomaceti TaxID=2021998 RepID=UPI001C2D167A|nr:hypothetical protein [Novacetimonas pomaceti]MBV1834598.1 hypothetical protein [Novacetimonas pomaceti]
MSIQDLFDELDWDGIVDHYYERLHIHETLLSYFRSGDLTKFPDLLVGISDVHGNYSARDHDLGPRILRENVNSRKRLYEISAKFLELDDARTVPEIIRAAGMKYFQIGVGSEASCMLNPTVCWITNTRTVWAHLVLKHGGSVSRANAELALYRDGEEDSMMAYRNWRAIHRGMEESLNELDRVSKEYLESDEAGDEGINYLWTDAISSALYDAN